MLSTRDIIFLSCFIISVVNTSHFQSEPPSEFMKCAKDEGVDLEAEWKNFPNPPSAKMLCVFRCFAKSRNEINEDGSINIEAMFKTGPRARLPEQDKEEMRSCLSEIKTKIESCDDMKEVIQCLPNLFKPSPEFIKCAKEEGLNMETESKNHSPSAKMLCVVRCVAKSRDEINEDGSLNIEAMFKTGPRAGLPEQNKKEIKSCLSEIKTKMESCDDIKEVIQCFLKFGHGPIPKM